jgi:dTDP-4-amino-4,6-dideoxygalactose transaminase
MPQFQNVFESLVETSSFVLGEQVKQFELELATLEGAAYSVGVNNGTSALELAIRSLGLETGDEVITSALTFVATVYAIQESGLTPVLADVSPNFPLLDPVSIEEKISNKTKAIVIVSLHGIVDRVDDYRRIADKYNLKLVLDGAQSHLGRYDNKPLAEFFDLITLSFYPGKNLGALGEGGAVITNNSQYAKRIELSRNWGSREKYLHEFWGGNYRLEPLQAAMLRLKLPHLRNWTDDRKVIGTTYRSQLPPEVLTQANSDKGDHVFHMFTIQTSKRKEMQAEFNAKEIGWGIHYPYAVHQNPFYSELEVIQGELKNSEYFAERTLSLPVFPMMQDFEQQEVIQAVLNVIG